MSPGPVGTVRLIAATLLRNLPLALLFSTGYLVFFSQLWGPLHPVKVVAAALLLVGGSLSLAPAGTERPRIRIPGRPRRESRASVERATSPVWRRVAAMVTGLDLCFIGLWQTFGTEAGRYVLLSGLCFIVSLALGVSMFVYGLPRARRRRARGDDGAGSPPSTPWPDKGGGTPALDNVDVRGSSFQVPIPKHTGNVGWFGGVGSKPAPRAWTPGGRRTVQGRGPVPEKFRGLKLLRGRRSRVARGMPLGFLLLLLVIIGLIASTIWWLDDLP